MGGDTGHPLATRAGQGGAPPPDDVADKNSQRTTAGRAQIGLTNTAAAATVGHRIFLFFGHSRPTHTSLPPFLDHLNSFPWSLFTDSSPFERYDENKFGRLLDRVFRPPQQPLDQGKVLLCSWSLGLSVDIKFVNFGRRLVGFPFLGHFE